MSSSQSSPGRTPKSMSSRLLTMKFMQRAAASTPTLPSTPEQPSAKRRKTGDSSPVFDVESLADQRAIEIALADEQAKRQAALEKQATEAGDTRWILNFEPDRKGSNGVTTATSPLQVVQAGFATIDKSTLTSSYERSIDYAGVVGRKSFGKFNRIIEKLQDPDYESSSDSDGSGDDKAETDEDSENENPEMAAFIKEERDQAAKKLKAERKAKRKSEKAELVRLAEKRKKKNVNLNESPKLKSISSGGLGAGRPDTRTCYSCGEPGHLASDCPVATRSRRPRDEYARPR